MQNTYVPCKQMEYHLAWIPLEYLALQYLFDKMERIKTCSKMRYIHKQHNIMFHQTTTQQFLKQVNEETYYQ